MKEKEQLPGWPRGLSRKLAASYIGVSIALFDDMVRDGRMPLPVHINRRVVWDIRLIDRAFERLAGWDVENDPYVAAVEREFPTKRRFGDRLLGREKEADGRWMPPKFEQYRGEEWIKKATFYKPGEWEAKIKSAALGLREKRALGRYFRMKGTPSADIKGAGYETVQRLVAREFLTVVTEGNEVTTRSRSTA